jgi:hypothetical protein
MDGISHVEQVRCHEQNMSKNISYMKHFIFEGFQTHPQIMKFITDTAKKYCFIKILAHLLVKSLVNQNRNFEPIRKLTLNMQNLESLYREGTKVFLRAFQTDPSPRNWEKQLLTYTSLICAVSHQPTPYCRSGMRKNRISTPT